ncbi:hypothetical protein NJBCHELONAE_43240 [Mycobacteroides chelonae]|uniref:hypothetical protein n=1 Tax=Mycobacteroides chelonae TaxID=1774 RepID=UPI0021DBEC02|nr:hypothetical protein [Mycobacteroides chelonae]GLE59013.1 hypothetical protein NJBCHELONAE_43240 [Mycobacteroides chelonae]
MAIFPFPNHHAFADRIKALRTGELSGRTIGAPALEDAGGPSTSHQSRIENRTTMPITREVISQYDTAWAKLAPEAINAGFVTALAAAYGAAHQAQQDPTAATAIIDAALTGNPVPAAGDDHPTQLRAALIADYAARQAPDFIHIGVDVDTDRPVFASSLGNGPRRIALRAADVESRRVAAEFGDFIPADYLPRLAAQSSDQFGKLLVRIARRHPAITLGSESRLTNAGEDLRELWESAGGSVHRNVEAAIDPIAGINTLTQARKRAKILVQRGGNDDELSLAWMILFANAIAEGAECGALDAYIRYANTGRWTALKSELPDYVRGGLPHVEHLQGVAATYLRPWASARREPQFESSFQRKDLSAGITWRHEEVKTSYEIPITAGDLWLEDESLEVPLDDVLHTLGTFSLRVTGNTLSVTRRADNIEPVHYSWYPSGTSDRFALVHNAETGWRAIQIY